MLKFTEIPGVPLCIGFAYDLYGILYVMKN